MNQTFDLTELARNLAFRVTSHYGKTKHASIDPTIAEWVASLSYSEDRNYEEMKEEDIPIKYCDEKDFAGFSPSRLDQQ